MKSFINPNPIAFTIMSKVIETQIRLDARIGDQ
jgi:hypothetical protein